VIIEQLERLSKERGTNISQVLKELSISPSSATNWKKGGDIKSSALIKIADYFQCSTDYILGRTDKTEPIYNIENHSSIYGNIKHSENNKGSLKPLEVEMLSHFRKLSTKEQLKAIEKLIPDEK